MLLTDTDICELVHLTMNSIQFNSIQLNSIHLRTISLIARCVSAWNSLPSSLVESKSVAAFKYNLKSIDLSSFLNYVF